MMAVDIARLMLSGLILIFLVLMVFMVAVTMIGGFVQPLTDSLNTDQTVGLTGEKYTELSDRLWWYTKWCFKLVIAFVIFIVGYKMLYDKEETSVYYGER